MATKTTSRKTASSARSTPKKPNGDSPKPARTATSAKGGEAKTAKVAAKSNTGSGEITVRATKPPETGAKAAPRRRESEGAPVKKAQAESGAAPLEVVPPAAPRPSREEIAARAAALWRQNGGPAFDNWIRAERELGA